MVSSTFNLTRLTGVWLDEEKVHLDPMRNQPAFYWSSGCAEKTPSFQLICRCKAGERYSLLRLIETLDPQPQKFVREIEIWRPLQHANILPFYGTVLIGSFLSMVSLHFLLV